MKLWTIGFTMFLIVSLCDTTIIADCNDCSLKGDLDNNCYIDFSDFSILARNWLTSGDSLKGDLDNSGYVDFNDLSILTENWLRSDNLIARIFALPSIAFSEQNNVLTEVAANVERTRTVAVCSNSDGVMRTAESQDQVPLNVFCSNSSYIFGCNDTNQRVYRSVDGDTWTILQTNIKSCSMFVTLTGRLLQWHSAGVINYRGITKTWYNIWYSDDNGDTWTPAHEADGTTPYYFGGPVWQWGVCENANGTICAAEYGSALYYPAYINRSVDNGATWAVVHTQDPTTISHYHALAYHAGTGKWLCNTGDNADKQYLLVSTDDGNNWSNYIEGKQDNYYQVTKYFDYGDPTKMLCGSDQFGEVFVFDLNEWPMSPIITNWENQVGSASSNLSVLIFKYDNVYYACQWDSRNSGTRQAVVSVSTDLIHWTVYYRIANTAIAGLRNFAGFKNGKLHLSDGTHHFVMSPAVVSNKTGVVLEPATTNLLNTTALSSLEGPSNISKWYRQSTTLSEITNSDSIDGDYCLHFARRGTSGGQNFLASQEFTVENDKWYIARVWLKGQVGRVRVYLSGCASNNMGSYIIGKDKWTEVMTYPVLSTSNSITLGITGETRRSDNFGEIYADGLQLEELPYTSWQVGGTVRAKGQLDYTVFLNNNWTDVITFLPHIDTYKMTNYTGNLYIRTYRIDDSNYAEIYYKPSDKKFYLEVTGTGGGATVASSAMNFIRDATIRISVSRSNGNLYLSVANGAPYEDLAAVLDNTIGITGRVILRSGNINGDYLMPMTLVEEYHK